MCEHLYVIKKSSPACAFIKHHNCTVWVQQLWIWTTWNTKNTTRSALTVYCSTFDYNLRPFHTMQLCHLESITFFVCVFMVLSALSVGREGEGIAITSINWAWRFCQRGKQSTWMPTGARLFGQRFFSAIAVGLSTHPLKRRLTLPELQASRKSYNESKRPTAVCSCVGLPRLNNRSTYFHFKKKKQLTIWKSNFISSFLFFFKDKLNWTLSYHPELVSYSEHHM